MSGNDEYGANCLVDFHLSPQEEIEYPSNVRMQSHLLAPHFSNVPWVNHPHNYMPSISSMQSQMMNMPGSALNQSQVPTTPPETPPGSTSSSGSLTPPHYDGIGQQSLDDKSWSSFIGGRSVDPQPLDLRPPGPLYVPEHLPEQQQDWLYKKFEHPSHQRCISGLSGKYNQTQVSDFPSVTSPCSAYQEIQDDELLSLTVRDLNKKLHNLPKDVQQRLKQRRRTLKNRGYAQSCRYKRQNYRQELESINKKLEDDKTKLLNEKQALVKQNNDLWREKEGLRKELEDLRSVMQQNIPGSPAETKYSSTIDPSMHNVGTDQSFFGTI